MKDSRLAICFAVCVMVLLLLPLYRASCQNYITYSVQINTDGSALWKITNFSDINASVDTFCDFQDKISNLVDSASSVTYRDMTVDENSVQINTTISADSKTTEYSFLWQNFSELEGNQLVFGDVFQVNGFFSQFYGDAAIQISYPQTFSVKSVTPTPYQRNDAAKTLEWARTQDLVIGKTEIILTSAPLNDNSSQNQVQLFTIIGVAVAVGVTLSLVGFFIFKRQKTLRLKAVVTLAEPAELETEEGKILKLLKSSGGSMRQSDIVDQSRFSKAKTSQLLAILERNGNITRYKKGRDKIVNLTERGKSE